jgi:predicted amidohydrolase YtcJ
LHVQFGGQNQAYVYGHYSYHPDLTAETKNIQKNKNMEKEYQDGELIELFQDGTFSQWNAETQDAYTCGETLEDFGIENLTQEEVNRCIADNMRHLKNLVKTLSV